MDCCECQGIEGFFNQREAARNLKAYLRNGPARSTRILLDALRAAGVEGATLLDIGGGIGAIQLDLLSAGASSATDVDASTAYIAVAREEGARRGYSDRVTYQHGNFVDLAPTIAPADIVTLDRVICCYHDMQGLVGTSAAKARRLYGLVYPRDAWFMRMGGVVINFLLRLQRNPFRFFTHRTRAVEALLREAGLERRFQRDAGVWQVAVYARA
jgi:2-polyprenyl-3-methyl-5-hydroxy-6-metoxy-1,4-benzoquinol methylase